MKKTRKLSGLLAALMLTTTLTACGGSEETPDASGDGDTPAATDTIRVALNSEPTSMFPGLATSVVANFVGGQMFDTLVEKDRATGEYIPGLATEWVYEDDTTLVFTLREGVLFHNGETMTAEDVKFSLDVIRSEGFSITLTSFIDSIEVRDANTVAVNFAFPYGPALECFSQSSLGIFPQAVYEADPEGFPRNPVGTGPYKFVEWQSGASIKMEAFADYYGEDKASIPNAEFVIYNNAATSAALALENGELDLVTSVAATDYSRLESNEEIQYGTAPSSRVTFIMFSMREGSPFNDKNMRLAFAHGIDKESVMIGATEGNGTLAIAHVPSYSFGLSDFDYTPPQYDPELAKEYLAEAGYPDGFDINLDVSSSDLYYIPAEIIQAQLAEVGINVNVNKMDSNAWFEDVFRAKNFDFQVCTFSTTVPDVDYYYEMFVSTGYENFPQLNSPELDEAYLKSRTTADLEERKIACQEVVRVLGDEALIVPIYQNDLAVAASLDLKGLVPDSEGIYDLNDLSW